MGNSYNLGPFCFPERSVNWMSVPCACLGQRLIDHLYADAQQTSALPPFSFRSRLRWLNCCSLMGHRDHKPQTRPTQKHSPRLTPTWVFSLPILSSSGGIVYPVSQVHSLPSLPFYSFHEVWLNTPTYRMSRKPILSSQTPHGHGLAPLSLPLPWVTETSFRLVSPHPASGPCPWISIADGQIASSKSHIHTEDF